MMLDYQWPEVVSLSDYKQTLDWQVCERKYVEIESTLTQRFGVDAVLLPSARAGIASILEFYGISRKHQVYAPNYSSHCVWDAIGRVSNPTTILREGVDVILAVHKWGYRYGLNNISNAIVIEDSVDNLITGGNLFPLNGEFEILSLPKTIGSYCGGVVLTKNTDYVERVKATRLNNKALVTHQSSLKYKKYMNKLPLHISPEMNEAENRGLDLYGLKNIESNLPNYDINLMTAKRRSERLNMYFNEELIDLNKTRVPCLYPAKLSHFNVAKPELFMQRQFNWSLSLDIDAFEPCWLLPMHFGISDKIFESMLTSMTMQEGV